MIRNTKLLSAQIQLRCTPQERSQIQADARTRGMSVNTYLRTVALKLPSEEQLAMAARLAELESKIEKLEKR